MAIMNKTKARYTSSGILFLLFEPAGAATGTQT
jgi:hypothetical protein